MMTIANSRLKQIQYELVSYDEASNTVVRLLEEVRTLAWSTTRFVSHIAADEAKTTQRDNAVITIAEQIKGLSDRVRTDSKALQYIVAGGID